MVKVDLADDVFAAIQEHAVPLVDDVNSVLRRVLQVTPSVHMDRAESGSLLHIDEFVAAVRRVLHDAEAIDERSGLPRREIRARVEQLLTPHLTERDYTRNKSGKIRWEHRTDWVLTRLKLQGEAGNDGKGKWWLTQ